MKVSEKTARFFDPSVRSRGLSYYKDGCIEVTEFDDDHLIADAYGKYLYEVEIIVNYQEKKLFMSCSCPFYTGGNGPCKHIWAAILTAEDEGWSLDLPDLNQLIELDAEAEADDYNDEYEEGIEDDYGYDYEGEHENEDDELFYDEMKKLQKSLGKILPGGLNARDILTGKLRPQYSKHAQKKKWQGFLENLKALSAQRAKRLGEKEKQIFYLIDSVKSVENNGVHIEILISEKKNNGQWGVLKPGVVCYDKVKELENALDREIISSLLGATVVDKYYYYGSSQETSSKFILPPGLHTKILKDICQTGRAKIQPREQHINAHALQWDDSGPWEFQLQVTKQDTSYKIEGFFARNGVRMSIDKPHLLISGSFIFWEHRVAPLNDYDSFAWILQLRKEKSFEVPLTEGMNLLEGLYSIPVLPPIELPEEMQLESVYPELHKELVITTNKNKYESRTSLLANVNFRYGSLLVPASSQAPRIVQGEEQKVIHRNTEKENDAFQELLAQGFKSPPRYNHVAIKENRLEIVASKFLKAVPELLNAGWRVEADGKLYRKAESFNMSVSSGIDWFELHGNIHFDQNVVSLPQLLAEIKKGNGLVELGDGTFGILPEKWLEKYAPLAGLGNAREEYIEFKKNQTGLLDALIASQPEISVDKTFAQIRDNLMTFEGLKPKGASKDFDGTLRDYQKDGLGWLTFLQEFGLGGCLADDMGLGKTVQVLALLETRRKRNATLKIKKPTIIVVPRSLLFNWLEEAKKFTPQLSVLIYSGTGRKEYQQDFGKYDLVLTTYGTLRRDIPELVDIEFDYAVLDEAQAVKNANSQSAKATRLLNAEHRLALSGTPIENHLGDLWSLFEFLNPGMLGKLKAFKTIKDDASRDILKRGLRPFILRRTKSQVAKDLPMKTEQIIYCEMDRKQQAMYDEIKRYYQANLMGAIQSQGMGKTKIQVLEALLRLRQAACHPGLIDKKRVDESSAKLDSLWEQLMEIFEEGHKALVFSQFTSFLSIFRKKLDSKNIPYLYLDGRTRKRQECVETFQNDDKFKLFLISLKAGGLGLNLTAAEYVFILDPWWNPAVEVQAIDRAHRIGQTKSVFAYRFISRKTVEEKVLELQKNKRELVESIITEDNSIIKNLTQDDLAYLLS